MQIDGLFVERRIMTLEKSLQLLNSTDPDKIEYDMYRSACVKEFEIILEQSGKLLKKCLKPFFSSAKEVDQLYFKDIFRQAGHHGLLSIEEVERWLIFRLGTHS